MRIRGANVLVTGGAGFVGSHVVDLAIARGAHVTVLDDLSEGTRDNLAQAFAAGADLVQGDVRDFAGLCRLIRDRGIQVVFHLAADASVPRSVEDPRTHFEINAGGTCNVLTAAHQHGAHRVIYASSASVYGEPVHVPFTESEPIDPISPYGASKLAGECLGVTFYRSLGLSFIAFRILNAYGPRQRHNVKFDLLRKLHRDPTRLEVMGTGNQLRDYVYISDVARAFVSVAESDIECDVFNLSSGEPTSVREVAFALVEALGLETEVYFTGKSWAGDVMRLVGDSTKLRDALGWEPRVRFKDGVKALVDWYIEEYAASNLRSSRTR